MIIVKALIKLYEGKSKRQTPFKSGYRPLFNFVPPMKTSGQITLHNRQEFLPGEEGIVEITFLSSDYLGDNFGVGTRFTFDEGQQHILGEGEIKQIVQ
jgi:elongation factor Tu